MENKKQIPALRLFVYIFCAACFVAMIAIFAVRIANGTAQERLAVLICNCLLWLIPFVLRPIVRDGISDTVYAVFAVFTFFASLLGSVVVFYGSIWWYDLLIHALFGYLGGVIGLFFVCKLSDVAALKPAFVMLVCFAVSIMFAALWEIFEFSGDVLLGNTAQGEKILLEDGTYAAAVTDTMEDIICNLVGAAVFTLQYLAHVLSKKSLLIGFMKRDFSPVKRPSSVNKE